MRCSELMRLNIYDVNAQRGIVTIQRGKGRKDRVVPIRAAALAWIGRYTETVRPTLVERTQELALFVSYRGHRFGRNNLSGLVRGYLMRGGTLPFSFPIWSRDTNPKADKELLELWEDVERMREKGLVEDYWLSANHCWVPKCNHCGWDDGGSIR